MGEKGLLMNNNSVVVYWSPFQSIAGIDSWHFLFQEPEKVRQINKSKKTANKDFFRCPAVHDADQNLFQIKLPIETEAHFQNNELIAINQLPHNTYLHNGKLALIKAESSFENYTRLCLNFQWLFFAEESLLMEETAPFFPTVAPAKNVLQSFGIYDIGNWLRPIMPDYHIPVDTKKLTWAENDAVMYLKFHTKKKIVFKRFITNQVLKSYIDEAILVKTRYKENLLLSHLYDFAKKSQFRERVLKEIKLSLID